MKLKLVIKCLMQQTSLNVFIKRKKHCVKFMTENIRKTYKKSNKKKITNINFTAKKVTEKFSINSRMQ